MSFLKGIFLFLSLSVIPGFAYSTECSINGGNSYFQLSGSNTTISVNVSNILSGDKVTIVDLGSVLTCRYGTYTGDQGSDNVDNLFLRAINTFVSGWYSIPGSDLGGTSVDNVLIPLAKLPNKSGNLISPQVSVPLSFGVYTQNNTLMISAGMQLAKVTILQNNNKDQNSYNTLLLTVIAANSVNVDLNTCTVSSPNVVIPQESVLPSIGSVGTSHQFTLPIDCSKVNARNPSYTLNWVGPNSNGNILDNTATINPATGVGIQLLDGDSKTIAPSYNYPLKKGVINNITLYARYYKFLNGPAAGNVNSVANVTLVYN